MSESILFSRQPHSSDSTVIFTRDSAWKEHIRNLQSLFDDKTTSYEGFASTNDNNHELAASHAAAKQMIAAFSTHIPADQRISLLKQTGRLFSDDEHDPEDELPSLDSFRTLLRTLTVLKPKKRPFLGLSEDGAFLASWFADEIRVALKFHKGDAVRWIINTNDDGEVMKGTGTVPARNLGQILETFKIRWLVDGEVRPDPGQRSRYAVG